MISAFKPTVGILVALLLTLNNTGQAQTSDKPIPEQSTAILDTAVLFAIGAQEADQALRGSFGWPTFQEGFVEGVYYRFDPDGYARFSSSPRLDEDVFETICAQASTACIAKKSILEIGLTPAGQIQIRFNGITPNDSFFVSDRKSELPLPPSILEPLTPRLEALLSGGGDLIIKREVEVVQSISLSGFSAVTTYLRWVAQNQSPRVFPRGWPVPAQSQRQTTSSLTQPNQWSSPNSAPQVADTTWSIQQKQNDARYLVVSPNRGGRINQENQTSVQVGSLQRQILQLQNHLQQIQTGYESNRNAFRPNLNLRPPSEDLQEFGQSFAQQAQGRSLPASPGGLGVGGDSTSITPNYLGVGSRLNPNIPANNGSVVYQQKRGPLELPDQLLLTHRIDALEYSIQQLRRDYSVQIIELREELLDRTSRRMSDATIKLQQPTLSSRPPATLQSFQNGTPAVPNALEELEKTLLARLGQQNQGVITNQAAPLINPDDISINRQIIEDILSEINGKDDLLNSASRNGDTTPKPKSPDGDDFVTLNDYINKVLQSKKQNLGDPSR